MIVSPEFFDFLVFGALVVLIGMAVFVRMNWPAKTEGVATGAVAYCYWLVVYEGEGASPQVTDEEKVTGRLMAIQYCQQHNDAELFQTLNEKGLL